MLNAIKGACIDAETCDVFLPSVNHLGQGGAVFLAYLRRLHLQTYFLESPMMCSIRVHSITQIDDPWEGKLGYSLESMSIQQIRVQVVETIVYN